MGKANPLNFMYEPPPGMSKGKWIGGGVGGGGGWGVGGCTIKMTEAGISACILPSTSHTHTSIL